MFQWIKFRDEWMPAEHQYGDTVTLFSSFCRRKDVEEWGPIIPPIIVVEPRKAKTVTEISDVAEAVDAAPELSTQYF